MPYASIAKLIAAIHVSALGDQQEGHARAFKLIRHVAADIRFHQEHPSIDTEYYTKLRLAFFHLTGNGYPQAVLHALAELKQLLSEFPDVAQYALASSLASEPEGPAMQPVAVLTLIEQLVRSSPTVQFPLRRHPLLPTRFEILVRPELAFTAAVPLRLTLPTLPGSPPDYCVTWNVAATTGIHYTENNDAHWESPELTAMRYERISGAIVAIAKAHAPQVICLQGVEQALLDLIKGATNQEFPYKIYATTFGVVTLVKLEQLTRAKAQCFTVRADECFSHENTKSPRNIPLASYQVLMLRRNDDVIILRNVHGREWLLPDDQAQLYRKLLQGDPATMSSVLVGDTGCAIAPIVATQQCIVDRIAPQTYAANHGGNIDVQAAHFTQGAFIRKFDGIISQLPAVALNFHNGALFPPVTTIQADQQPLGPHYLPLLVLTDLDLQLVELAQLLTAACESDVTIYQSANANNERSILLRFSADSLAVIMRREFQTGTDFFLQNTDVARGEKPGYWLWLAAQQQQNIFAVLRCYSKIITAVQQRIKGLSVLDSVPFFTKSVTKRMIWSQLLSSLRTEHAVGLRLPELFAAWRQTPIVSSNCNITQNEALLEPRDPIPPFLRDRIPKTTTTDTQSGDLIDAIQVTLKEYPQRPAPAVSMSAVSSQQSQPAPEPLPQMSSSSQLQRSSDDDDDDKSDGKEKQSWVTGPRALHEM